MDRQRYQLEEISNIKEDEAIQAIIILNDKYGQILSYNEKKHIITIDADKKTRDTIMADFNGMVKNIIFIDQ